MDANLKSAWVAALRSGQYTQCTGTLENMNGHNCCLGVFAHVAGIPIVNGGGSLVEGMGGYRPLDAYLAQSDRKRLWHMNDGYAVRKHSFAEIADWIEANIPAEVE